MTGSGQVITDADGLGLADEVAVGLGVAVGLALADGLAEDDALADGDAGSLVPSLGLGSADDSSTDSCADGDSCGAASSVAAGSSVPVRAVMVSDSIDSGADSLVSSTVGVGESDTDAEGVALGDGEAEGALLGEGDAEADGDSEGEGESDAVGDADDDGETDALGDADVDGEADGEALISIVGSQRAGISAGITQDSGSSAAESSEGVVSSLSLSTAAGVSCCSSAAFAGKVDAANEDATTAAEAVHDTIARSIGVDPPA